MLKPYNTIKCTPHKAIIQSPIYGKSQTTSFYISSVMIRYTQQNFVKAIHQQIVETSFIRSINHDKKFYLCNRIAGTQRDMQLERERVTG